MMAKPTTLVWAAWNNGQHRASGAGYGLKVPREDRDAYFHRSWTSVTVILPVDEGTQVVEVNIAKASFWTEACRELISVEIGKWLIARGLAPWPDRRPPRLVVVQDAVRRFVVNRVLAS
jgi:hypothetical protein